MRRQWTKKRWGQRLAEMDQVGNHGSKIRGWAYAPMTLAARTSRRQSCKTRLEMVRRNPFSYEKKDCILCWQISGFISRKAL